MQKMIQLIQYHSRAHANGATLQINVRDLLIVSRKINDQSLPERPARKSRARAARNDGDAGLAGRLDDGARLFGAPRKCHRQRLDLVDRSVGCVQLPGEIVEGDLAIHRRERRDLLSRSHRVGIKLLLMRVVYNSERALGRQKEECRMKKTEAGGDFRNLDVSSPLLDFINSVFMDGLVLCCPYRGKIFFYAVVPGRRF